MATRKRHTPEQAVRKLSEADRLLSEGKDIAEVCRHLQITQATYYRWRNQFGGLKADDAKRLKDLERENSTLKDSPRRTSRPGMPARRHGAPGAGARGQRTVRLPGDRATSKYTTAPSCYRDHRRSRFGVV